MTLRDRLATKAKRRAVVVVEVAPATDDQVARAASLRSKLVKAVAGNSGDEDDLQTLLEAVEGENQAQVGFTALDPGDFEKLLATCPAADGGIDKDKALPVLAALCADDEDLQDDQWWADQLTAGSWSYGERAQLWATLLALNTNAPGAYVPKG